MGLRIIFKALLLTGLLSVTGCRSSNREIVVTATVKSHISTVLKLHVCEKMFEIADAERKGEIRLVDTCRSQPVLYASVRVGDHEITIERGLEMEFGKKARLDIKINELSVENTTYVSTYCPNPDELCGAHLDTMFFALKDGSFIQDPDSPSLSAEQRNALRSYISRRETIRKRYTQPLED